MCIRDRIETKNREIEKLNLQLEQQKLAGQEDARTPETAQAQISLNNAEELLAQAQAAYDQAAAEYEELANNPPPAQTGNIPDTQMCIRDSPRISRAARKSAANPARSSSRKKIPRESFRCLISVISCRSIRAFEVLPEGIRRAAAW